MFFFPLILCEFFKSRSELLKVRSNKNSLFYVKVKYSQMFNQHKKKKFEEKNAFHEEKKMCLAYRDLFHVNREVFTKKASQKITYSFFMHKQFNKEE